MVNIVTNNKSVTIIIASSWPAITQNQLTQAIPEISLLAKTKLVNFSYDHKLPAAPQWQSFVDLIRAEAADPIGGLVVLADLTLALYLSNVISFGWLQPTLPIIFTTGVEDLFFKKKLIKAGGVKANLINAVQLATLAKPQTVILDGFHLIAPSKAGFDQRNETNTLVSLDNQYIGKVDFGISFSEETLPVQVGWPHHNLFETQIQVINQGPFAAEVISAQAKGLIFVRHEPQVALAESFLASLEVPYVIFQPTLLLEKTSTPIVNYLTWHCLVVKFAWLLAATDNQTLITNGLLNPYLGEIMGS